MNNKMFVGNLPYKTTEEELKEMFAEFGEVTEAVILTDKFTGRSKGFGFVTMATEEEAQAAIKGLDQKEMDGRNIKVDVARPPREKSDY